jgi:hypothetical protein
MIRLCAVTAFLVLIAIPAHAGIKVFLYPRYATDESTVKVSEVAWIDGDEETVLKAKNAVMSAKVYKDGFIDRREITAALQAQGINNFTVIGNAVRIAAPDRSGEEAEQLAMQAVKKGDQVKLLLKKGRIVIEARGIASDDAVPGDVIQVEIEMVKNRKRTVKGTVLEEHFVEVKL